MVILESVSFDEAKVYVKEQSTAQFEFPTNIISAVYEVLDSQPRVHAWNSDTQSWIEEGVTADECDTMISDAWNRMQ